MPKLPKGKVGVYVYLDEKLLEELRKLAFSKYGRLRGVLSHEVEEALRNWLALHTQSAHKLSVGRVNPQPKVYKVWEQVKQYLRERFGYYVVPQQQVVRKHIIEAIAAVRGCDERTINKWMRRFTEHKLLKHIAGEVYEVV